MEKNITRNFENQNIVQENNFDSIKISFIVKLQDFNFNLSKNLLALYA